MKQPSKCVAMAAHLDGGLTIEKGNEKMNNTTIELPTVAKCDVHELPDGDTEPGTTVRVCPTDVGATLDVNVWDSYRATFVKVSLTREQAGILQSALAAAAREARQ